MIGWRKRSDRLGTKSSLSRGARMPTAVAYRRTLLVANKQNSDAGELALLGEFSPARLRLAARTRGGPEELRQAAWRLIDAIRVWQTVGEAGYEKPFALAGSTVLDFAAAVHRDLPAKLKSARIWGPSARFPGQSVERDHTLADSDVVELHT